jgi:hypothetical protein
LGKGGSLYGQSVEGPPVRGTGGAGHGGAGAERLESERLRLEKNPAQFKKKRDEAKFREAEAEIEELIEKTKLGELTLSYMDEAGFVQTQPNRSAWTETGEVHLITAARGKRLNVMAALISTGELFTAKFWETTTAALFAGFLGLLLESVGRPLTVILDNASIHKAKEIQPLLALLREQGLTLYFLPPYSPELNRIEKLWHKMKYEWMAFKARNSAGLEADVDKILDGFGSDYRMTFC